LFFLLTFGGFPLHWGGMGRNQVSQKSTKPKPCWGNVFPSSFSWQHEDHHRRSTVRPFDIPNSVGLKIKLRWRKRSILRFLPRSVDWIMNVLFYKNIYKICIFFEPAIGKVWRRRWCLPFHRVRELRKLYYRKLKSPLNRRLYCAEMWATRLGLPNRIAVIIDKTQFFFQFVYQKRKLNQLIFTWSHK
jgi:hypothetical protein